MTKLEIDEHLKNLLRLAWTDHRTHPSDAVRTNRLRQVLAVAYAKGWGQRPMADVIGVTRQSVNDHLNRADPVPADSELWNMIADPPKVTRWHKENPDFARMDADERKYLQELSDAAARCNGATGSTHPDRIASENYTALLVKYLDIGYTVKGLAEEIGVSDSSIYNRLRRHGVRGKQEGIRPYGIKHPYRKED